MSDSNKIALRALIYNRASADPSGAGVSVDSQEAENRAWCTREGWAIVGVVTDNDRSASRYAAKSRDGYDTVKRALAGETHGRVDILVCWESSRANRDLGRYVVLRDLCAESRVLFGYRGRVHDMRSGDDRFSTGLDALVDEREAERARDRTLRSHRASVAAGRPRSFAPFGYLREYDPHTRRLIGQVPDPDTAPVVAELVERILAGHTLYAIAQDLNGRGVLNPRARRAALGGATDIEPRWSASVIRNLLAKHSLMGIRAHHGKAQGDATWEGIVTPADWQAVQQVLADPSRRADTGGRTARHLLSGVAECGVCGGWMRPLTNRGRATYVCGGTVPTAGKGHVARARQPLDDYVTAAVVARLARPDLADTLDDTPDADGAAAEVRRHIADLRGRLEAFEESAAQGGITPAAFGRIEARLTADIKAAERALPSTGGLPPAIRALARPDAAQLWKVLPLSDRRQVVRTLVRVQVDPMVRRGVRKFDPTSVRVTWRTRG